ncbi:MAG TPA: hypothetical protein VEA16_00835 [Vicinamibacterales bacterium]|nr:hypothetical protein [Vicinamibacterales bacterium]
MILAILAEVSVLLCLIFTFDGALHSWSSARLTWDHFAVAGCYSLARVEFSRRRAKVGNGSFRVGSREWEVGS